MLLLAFIVIGAFSFSRCNLNYFCCFSPQVLPPWGRLYHWQTRELGPQTRIPWRDFFDVESIARFVPAVDLDEYLGERNAKIKIPT